MFSWSFWSLFFTRIFSIEFRHIFFYLSSGICHFIAFYALVMCLSIFRVKRIKQDKSGKKKCKNQNMGGYRCINTDPLVNQHGACRKATRKRKKTKVSESTRAPVLINTARVEKPVESAKQPKSVNQHGCPRESTLPVLIDLEANIFYSRDQHGHPC